MVNLLRSSWSPKIAMLIPSIWKSKITILIFNKTCLQQVSKAVEQVCVQKWNKTMLKKITPFLIRPPPELLPVFGPLEQWCATYTWRGSVSSSRAGSDLGPLYFGSSSAHLWYQSFKSCLADETQDWTLICWYLIIIPFRQKTEPDKRSNLNAVFSERTL